MKRIMIAASIIVVTLAVLLTAWLFQDKPEPVAAQSKSDSYIGRGSASYRIYYEVSEYELHVLDNVTPADIVELGTESFLVIKTTQQSSKMNIPGFIRMSAIKAVLPRHIGQPDSTVYTEK